MKRGIYAITAGGLFFVAGMLPHVFADTPIDVQQLLKTPYKFMTTNSIPLPCNYPHTPKNPLLRSCDVAVPELANLLKERTKVLIRGQRYSRGGYYGGQVLTFYDGGAIDYFPQISCDLLAGETSTNMYAQGCGGRCDFGDSGGYYIDLKSCKRENAWIRGSWIRNVSSNWLRIKGQMNEARVGNNGTIPGVCMPTMHWYTSSSSNTAGVKSSPCGRVAQDYLDVLNRIRKSKIFTTGIMTKYVAMSESECIGKDGKPPGDADVNLLGACHLLSTRKFLESMFVYVTACFQMGYAMDDHMSIITNNGYNSVFKNMEDRTANACDDVDSFGDFKSCYGSHYTGMIRTILSGTHAGGPWAGYWEYGAGELPLVRAGQ